MYNNVHSMTDETIKIRPYISRGSASRKEPEFGVGYDVLLKAEGKVALLAAKSILSTEILNILYPVTKFSYSPLAACKEIMRNIDLDSFVGLNDPSILEALLYNEFYKLAMDIDQSINSNNGVSEVPQVVEKLRPTLHNVMILLKRV